MRGKPDDGDDLPFSYRFSIIAGDFLVLILSFTPQERSRMHSRDFLFVLLAFLLVSFPALLEADHSRYRIPAPLEDGEPRITVPVFGRAAGLEGCDRTLSVVEWVAKRTWHVLGKPFERKDFTGPPAMKAAPINGWIEIKGTVASGGVPLRNQVIACEVMQYKEPVLILLRSTDAFGEIMIELDALRGALKARMVRVSRSMIGGQSHSSPMPEQSFNQAIATTGFDPVDAMPFLLTIKTQGADGAVQVNGKKVASFEDTDPAGGRFAFGSTGTIRVRSINQWELVTAYEKRRRTRCIDEIETFCRKIDSHYDEDVKKKNRVELLPDGLLWKWPQTGAAARFKADGGRIEAVVRAGLYGNDTLVEGTFPEVSVVSTTGELYTADPGRSAEITGTRRSLAMRLPLKSGNGKEAEAHVVAEFTVQTVWFWTVTIEGMTPKKIRAHLAFAPPFSMKAEARNKTPDAMHGIRPQKGKAVLRHNGKAGIYAKAILPECTTLGARTDSGACVFTAEAEKLRFATVVLPAQPLNLTGFKHRMVHFIRYPEGPVQHWRRRPSRQEYPADVDLARYAHNGTDAMVWHHTWLSNNYYDHEGFFVNHREMQRAMEKTHRLGMKMIGYLGIVPGRNALLRFEDTCPLGGASTYGTYTKNWDLQDHTFYHAIGRYPKFLAWMTEYWCRRYKIDGYYLDGGAFGLFSRGAMKEPAYAEDAGRSLDEIQHRNYYRIKKVLELNGAGYGLEPWSGLDWMLNGFYDCMMIGESFQEAPPEYYRDGHNALLTGCSIKMYGMRASSQNPYNLAMAAVNLSDIQVCSGNGAWGDAPDTAETWKRVRPLWDLLDSIDWDDLIEARPWYAQELVRCEGCYAGNYTTSTRVVIFLVNKTETPGTFKITVNRNRLPETGGKWHVRYCLGKKGELGPFPDGPVSVQMPALHDGPVGIELYVDE